MSPLMLLNKLLLCENNQYPNHYIKNIWDQSLENYFNIIKNYVVQRCAAATRDKVIFRLVIQRCGSLFAYNQSTVFIIIPHPEHQRKPSMFLSNIMVVWKGLYVKKIHCLLFRCRFLSWYYFRNEKHFGNIPQAIFDYCNGCTLQLNHSS